MSLLTVLLKIEIVFGFSKNIQNSILRFFTFYYSFTKTFLFKAEKKGE